MRKIGILQLLWLLEIQTIQQDIIVMKLCLSLSNVQTKCLFCLSLYCSNQQSDFSYEKKITLVKECVIVNFSYFLHEWWPRENKSRTGERLRQDKTVKRERDLNKKSERLSKILTLALSPPASIQNIKTNY